MRIYHNIPALISYNSLAATNRGLQKSIAKLSTGLRINGASDDAAGLAISEKMRAQVRGLDQATANAQDGINMIQTAEGALNETHSILQRMRELSVQSANDTLTSNDRQYIQIEVDQLKEEIDRIANTTQFNKKKLLDGSAAVLWSSDKLSTKALIRGGLREIDQFGQKNAVEGNFKLKIVSEAGQSQMQKSDLFKVKHENVISNVYIHPDSGINEITVSNAPSGDYVIDVNNAAGGTTGYAGTSLSVWGGGAATAAAYYTAARFIGLTSVIGFAQVEVLSAAALDNVSVKFTFNYAWSTGEVFNMETTYVGQNFSAGVTITGAAGSGFSISASATSLTHLNQIYGGEGNSLWVSFNAEQGMNHDAANVSSSGAKVLEDFRVNSDLSATTTALNDFLDIGASEVLNKGNNVSQLWEVVDVGNEFVRFSIKSNFISISGYAGTDTKEVTLAFTPYSSGEIFDLTLSLSQNSDIQDLGGGLGFGTLVLKNATGGGFVKGDKVVLESRGIMTHRSQSFDEIDLNFNPNTSWDYGWDAGNDLYTSSFAFKNDALTQDTYHFRRFYLNSDSGQSYDAEVALDVTGTLGSQDLTPAASFHVTYIGEVANGDVKLRDLDKFWDANGNFLIENPQTIKIVQGDGTTASITLYEQDTLDDVAEKLNNAIRDDMGQGKYSGDGKFVQYISTAADSGPNAVEGTFVIRSAVTGKAGELNFIGDEGLINALSLNQIQSSKENQFTVSIEDAHTGVNLKNGIHITGNVLYGELNKNVDVEFDAMAGITVSYSNAQNKFIYSDNTAGTPFETVVHLADNTTVFQIGANEKEDMGINIGSMNTRALGVDRILLTDRVSAGRAITTIDNAIDRVSSQRANLGAYQNRLEHTINNLTVAGENLTSAESRIRDLDMAKEMMNFTKLNILSQAGNSMLAQANQLPQAVLSLLR